MPYPNDSQIVAEVYRASERFRTKPREEYLKSAATHLVNKGLSVYQVRKILIEAAQTLDHFPSLAELEDLSKGFTTSTPVIPHGDCVHCESRGYDLWEDEQGHTCIIACKHCPRGKVYEIDKKKYGCSDADRALQLGYMKKERPL